MAFAQGSRSSLTYIVETVFGTTPGTPTMIELPFNTHTLDLAKERVQGNEIRSDRMPRVDRHGNKSVAGDIVVELRDTDYDDFIESAFFSSLDSTGVMKIGTTPKFMTIEDGAQDITQFRQFLGCSVSTMNVSVAPNQMVMTTFGMVGKTMNAMTATTLDATPTAPSGGEPFDSYSGAILEGGGAIATLTGIDFTITNAMAPTFVIGADTTPQLEYGRATVEGSVTAFFEDATLIDKFINETASSLSFTADDPASGGSYTFLMPNIKFNGAAVPVSNEQSRMITLPFVALYDVSEATNIKLTKA